MVVTSGSMEPGIRVGDAVMMRPPSPGEIRNGDVITFKPFGSLGLVTHRVVATSEIEGNLYFQSQGDANAISTEGAAWESPASVRYLLSLASLPLLWL